MEQLWFESIRCRVRLYNRKPISGLTTHLSRTLQSNYAGTIHCCPLSHGALSGRAKHILQQTESQYFTAFGKFLHDLFSPDFSKFSITHQKNSLILCNWGGCNWNLCDYSLKVEEKAINRREDAGILTTHRANFSGWKYKTTESSESKQEGEEYKYPHWQSLPIRQTGGPPKSL